MNKSLAYIFILIGGVIGSYAPVLFGQSAFSVAGVLGGGIGALAGLWLAFKLSS